MGASGMLGCEWASDAELMDGSAELSCSSHRLRQDTAYSMVCTEAKKHCWYFEGLYPTYYICRSYEDCCGSRCCVRALSIQRLWYFWFLLMMGVLFCCGAGFFIRRRMYPPPLVEEPTFNVSYTRQPVNTASGSQQSGVPYYTDPGGPVMNPMAMAFHVQPNSPQGNPVYPPPPSYCNTPPPPYEQVVKSST
ncbi:vesicular, overexpressed in cancer, prosurvival protein 1 isoform X3 [Coturnix japonica]|uniref:vesicular, overexpressed in cancer, prosurvival protein 1 isoform X3 n=1 Tax=Coturnix japonica TaxID=93934 RepID=UPI0013A5CFC4|nr:vesicular, overexpressed in cancer, prosurvival protein 1 isoform X3 [Coturnix japonica]